MVKAFLKKFHLLCEIEKAKQALSAQTHICTEAEEDLRTFKKNLTKKISTVDMRFFLSEKLKARDMDN